LSIQPINHEKPLQFDAISRILSKGFGHIKHIEPLTAHICDEKSSQSLEQVIYALLEQKIHIHQLLTTFSACEKNRLQHAFDSTSTLPEQTQLASAKNIINHFNGLQDSLLMVADDYFKDQQQRGAHNVSAIQEDTGNRSNTLHSKKDIYRQSIAKSIQSWKKSKSIMIHNYYRGLAIRARIAFLDASDGKILLQLNEELARIFAAHPSQNTAFAICQGEDIQVRLHIEETSEGKVWLNIDEALPVFSESRKHLNVQVDEHVPVSIHINKKRPIQAQLHDLSMGGLGVIVQGISQSPCQISDQVELQMMLNRKEVKLEGTVRWTGISEHEARLGIELNERFNTKQAIQKEIFRIQRGIIVTINHLDIPQALAQEIPKSNQKV